jgi:hypothetical protein
LNTCSVNLFRSSVKENALDLDITRGIRAVEKSHATAQVTNPCSKSLLEDTICAARMEADAGESNVTDKSCCRKTCMEAMEGAKRVADLSI